MPSCAIVECLWSCRRRHEWHWRLMQNSQFFFFWKLVWFVFEIFLRSRDTETNWKGLSVLHIVCHHNETIKSSSWMWECRSTVYPQSVRSRSMTNLSNESFCGMKMWFSSSELSAMTLSRCSFAPYPLQPHTHIHTHTQFPNSKHVYHGCHHWINVSASCLTFDAHLFHTFGQLEHTNAVFKCIFQHLFHHLMLMPQMQMRLPDSRFLYAKYVLLVGACWCVRCIYPCNM